MKKYWKLTAIIAVIVLSIGTFYVSSARSAEAYPEFVIETISGDVREIESLVLRGSYTDTALMNTVSTNLKLTADGSTYNSRSFLDQLIGHPPTLIKGFQEEYRTFMRGKSSDVALFFENKQVLAYADVDYNTSSLKSRDFKFDISVLNKEDGNIDSFTVGVPDSEELEYLYVEGVQLVESELHLITHNALRNNDDNYEEKHLYTIDMTNQKISNHESIIQVPSWQDDTYINIQLVRTSPTKAFEHLIIQRTEEKIIEDTESTRTEDIKQELIAYNLATKEKEEIILPDLSLKEFQLSFFDGSIIYFTRLDGQELVVTPYRLMDKQVGKTFSIQLSSDSDQVPMITVSEGKLYAITPQMYSNLNNNVIVADANTGETLFNGQVAIKGSLKEQENFELYIYEVFVK